MVGAGCILPGVPPPLKIYPGWVSWTTFSFAYCPQEQLVWLQALPWTWIGIVLIQNWSCVQCSTFPRRTSCVKAWRTSALHWKTSFWWKKLTTLFQCEIHSMDDVRGFWFSLSETVHKTHQMVIISLSCKAYSGTNEFAAKIVEGCPCSHEVDPYWKHGKQTGPGFGTDHIFVDRDPVLFTMVAQYMRQNDPFAMFKTEGRPFERELRYFGITLRVVLYLQSTFFWNSHRKDESHALFVFCA